LMVSHLMPMSEMMMNTRLLSSTKMPFSRVY
jgi:hypothetical protein